MKKCIWLFLLLMLLAVPAAAEQAPFADFAHSLPVPAEQETLTMGSSQLLRRTDGEFTRYDFADGDIFLQMHGSKGGTWLLPLQTLTVRTLNPDGTWYVVRNPRTLLLSSTAFLETDGLSLVLSPPLAYEKADRDCLQARPEQDGCIRIRRRENGFLVEQFLPATESTWDWHLFATQEKAVVWTNSQRSIWLGYDMTGQYRFTQKGFYQRSPESYDPTGEGIYFLNPASYIPAKFIATGGSRAADKMGIAMLDMVRRNIGPQGFIPISTQSGWLYTDFGIGHGYYDTRWSTDLALALADAHMKFNLPAFWDTVQQAADHLQGHIAQNGFRLSAQSGLLPPDYSWHGDYKTPHCSLNHALAEALLLYKAGRTQAADALVSALCQADWLRPDGNLKYGILPDGREIGTDYPYLTYNDLVLLKRYFAETMRPFPQALAQLMASKLNYMLTQNITGYLPG